MADQPNVFSAVRHELRNANRQQARRALVAASTPLRGATGAFARPQVSSTPQNRPVWGIREVGEYRSMPTSFGEVMADRPYDQSTVVLSIDGGEATFRNLHALDGQHRVLYEEQLSFGALPIALERLQEVEETYERVAYLSNTSPSNFYHWLLLVLPMLRFYKEAGVESERFYVGEPLSDWQRRSLDFVGLSEDQIITGPCRAELAHVAVSTRPINGVPPDQLRWARAAFIPEEPPPGTRRLFVGRGSNILNRRMIDEEVIAEALERAFGFEYITTAGMTFDDEIELFGQAETIVAPFGAALTNMLFSPIGTKVLELQPYDNDFSLIHCYQEMSAVFCNPHAIIRGQKTPRLKRGLLSDISVPVDQVLREVELMMAESST